MSKKRVHFHSDCFIFGGCENMLVNFFNDEYFNSIYDISFTYRKNKDYVDGFNARVSRKINSKGLGLLDFYEILQKFQCKIRSLNLFFKIILHLLKPFFIIYNTAILSVYFMQNKKIDILHINNGGYPGAYSCMSCVFAAKLLGIKKIVYVVNNIAVGYKKMRILDYFFDLLVVKFVDIFITGSLYAGKQLKDVLHIPENKYLNIHNGILLRDFTENREDFSKRLNIKFNPDIIFGVVALLEKRKGHIYLLKAFKLLLEKNKKIVLLIEGVGSEYDEIVAYIKKNNLEQNIYLVGFEKNIFNFINNIDVFVLPSIENEDFPNVILEAFGSGKPVVATTIAGIPEQIVHLENGFLVMPKNYFALEEGLSFFLDKSKIASFGLKAKERFNNLFTKDISIRKYMDLYESLLRSK